ncbi:hypothetical protein ABIA06_005358 [Bradyrhizobium yuanmingense]|uniref:DUF2188 domain-containing protein n=1 Tax=Bradyrhizobium yuanmingense TaxID=108015 RepID=UPI00351557AC
MHAHAIASALSIGRFPRSRARFRSIIERSACYTNVYCKRPARPPPNPVVEATASGCKSLPPWTRVSRTWGEGPYGSYSTFVTLHNDEWTVVVNGKHSAPYATQKEAIRAAVDAAHADGKAGHDAQVLVQGKNTNLESSGHMATTHTHQPANRGPHEIGADQSWLRGPTWPALLTPRATAGGRDSAFGGVSAESRPRWPFFSALMARPSIHRGSAATFGEPRASPQVVDWPSGSYRARIG